MTFRACGVALVTVVLLGAGCGPAKHQDPPPDPDVFDRSTLDDAHVVSVLELGAGLDCSILAWCSAALTFERIEITVLDDWVGHNTVQRLLIPELAMETLQMLFGSRPRAVLAGRVEAPDDPVAFADTCGMPPFEAFTYPVDAAALWILDDDGARLWELQCVLAVAATLDDTGKDPQGRTLSESLLRRPGCFGSKSKARAQALDSQSRLPNRPAQVTAENRCHARNIPDAGNGQP